MARKFLASDGLSRSGVDPVWLAEMLPRVDPASIEIREAPRWFQALWAKGIVAVAMPWAIYFTPEMVDRYENRADLPRLAQLLVHELTHIEQLRRMGVLRHVAQYTADYVRGRFRRVGHWDAYRAIRLEVEARAVAQLTQGGPR
jgi:hypothetical protein